MDIKKDKESFLQLLLYIISTYKTLQNDVMYIKQRDTWNIGI